MRDFNPRSPHRERLCHSREPGRDAKISIHAPLTGSDADLFMYFRRSLISIHAPLTGSDMFYVFCFQFQPISIHAPLTGSDYLAIFYVFQNKYFNPRSPHRERLQRERHAYTHKAFQSTLPSQGATSYDLGLLRFKDLFQSTLPSQGATYLSADFRYPL